MNDPREYADWYEWYRATSDPLGERVWRTLIYADICARLDAKDVEIDALREAVIGISDNRADLVTAMEDIRDKACGALEWPNWQAKWCAQVRKQRGDE